MASRELALVGIGTIVSQLALNLLWFHGPGAQDVNKLAWANLTSSCVGPFFLFLVFVLHRPLRNKYGLSLGWRFQGESQQALAEPVGSSISNSFHLVGAIGRKALADGLLMMTLDLVLQCAGSAGVYLAGFQDLSVLYQLSSVGAAMPQFSAFATALAFLGKIGCSGLLGRGDLAGFRTLTYAVLVLSMILGIIAAVCIAPFQIELAGHFAKPSCAYASDAACLRIYANLFGSAGNDNLFDTFAVFCFAAGVNCIFAAVKALLCACQDFQFIAWSALATGLIIACPALLTARFYFASGTALYIASCLPVWTLTVIFCIRLQVNLYRMRCGISGPWSQEVM